MNPTLPVTVEQHPISEQRPVPSPLEPLEEKRPADRASTWTSFFVSVIVHVNILLILAMTFRALEEEPPPEYVIDTIFTPGEEHDQVLAEIPADVALDAHEAVFSEAAPLTADEMVRTEPKIDLAGLSGEGGAMGLGGWGAGGGVGFFGTTARGRSFVFVVDCSGSMKGSRFYRALTELLKSIKQLGPDQTFQIVFFNDQAQPLVHSTFGRNLIPAARTELKEVYDWIDHRHADGGTVPDEALRQALELKPDVIFFLTDAEKVPRKVRTLIAEKNTHGSIVHTIAFGHPGGETLMQGIAADHHGRYRFVP